jgi:outer membrane protein, multidrug efflux system
MIYGKLCLTLGTASAIVVLVAGCKVGPDYHAPNTKIQSTWEAGQIGQATRPTMIIAGAPLTNDWWTIFGDSELNRLVDQALKSSPDLAIAASRVRAARAQSAYASAAEMPKIGANASGTFNHRSGPLASVNADDYSFFQVGFDASWEIDLFGGARRGVEATKADLAAEIDDSHGTQLSLEAEVARTYFELRTAQRRLEIARRNLELQQRTYEITRERLAAGVVGELDVSQAESLVANTRAFVPSLNDQVSQSARRLGVLLGEEPDRFLSELAMVKPLPHPPAKVAVGLPNELLRQRPDVRAAERRVAAATARIGVATADLYPRLFLNGTVGQYDINTLSDLAGWDHRYFGIGPILQWKLFDAGRTRAQIEAARANTDRALAEYRKTVLNAVAEADNSLSAFNAQQERRASLAAAVAADQKSVNTANELYRQGVTEFLTVLVAERSVATSEDTLAQSEQALGNDLVALYKALGGGWQSSKFPVANSYRAAAN